MGEHRPPYKWRLKILGNGALDPGAMVVMVHGRFEGSSQLSCQEEQPDAVSKVAHVHLCEIIITHLGPFQGIPEAKPAVFFAVPVVGPCPRRQPNATAPSAVHSEGCPPVQV